MNVGARLIAVSAIAALALVLLACGGSSSGSVSAPTATLAEVSGQTPTATPYPSIMVNTIDDAIRLTAWVYTGHGANSW